MTLVRRVPVVALTVSALAFSAAQPVLADGPRSPQQSRTIATACPDGDVAGSSFSDISGSVHASAIACLRWYEIGRGATETSFGEGGGVTRAQMATFLARMLTKAEIELPADAPDAFPDDDATTHEAAINALAALGIVSGSSDGTYRPDQVVAREQMASFLARAAELIAEAELVDDGDYFADDDRSVHQTAVDKLAGLGIVAGRGPGAFDPAGQVTRGQMASFLMRLVDLLVEQGEVTKPASLDWPRGEWLPGDVLPVTIRGEGIVSVTPTGCGLPETPVADADLETAGIQFSLTVPESFPPDEDGDVEDECEVEFRVELTNGWTQVLEGEIELAEPEGDEEEPEGDEEEPVEEAPVEEAPVDTDGPDDVPAGV